MNITEVELARLTSLKRMDSYLKEQIAAALELPIQEIFNNRVQKVWSLHHPFTRSELDRFVTTN